MFRHAQEFGKQPSDTELWTKAREADWTIVTRDVDFFDRLAVMGAPPKVVWIRLGNIRRRDLCAKVEQHWAQICELLDQYDLISVFPDRVEAVSFSLGN